MKLTITTIICILTLRVESQSFSDQNQRYNDYAGSSRAIHPVNKVQNVNAYANYSTNINPLQNIPFGTKTHIKKLQVPERDSYLQAISRNDNTPNQQFPNRDEVANNDDRIHFKEPDIELSPPPFGENAGINYYTTQRNNDAIFLANSQQGNVNNIKQATGTGADHLISNNVTIGVSNFGLNLMKVASQLQSGNIITSPTSIATVLALLQQGATGDAQEQITRALQMTPDASERAFSVVTANMRKRNSRNVLSIANNLFVADAFELNNAYKTLAVRSFWSEISPTNFADPFEAVQKINTWVSAKTNDKITNLLPPGAISTASQLVLVNAVYFKGLWETKFKPERTQTEIFHLNNGNKKSVPFMHTRHAFQVGYDLNTRALVTILPFESHQYSLVLILPKKSDNVANVLSTLTVEQLLHYQTFNKIEVKIELPRFTLKTDTNLNPVLRNMGITNILGSKSDLSGIGLYRNFSPQISNAVHSGFLSIDEQGVTAAASTAFAAVALSYDDSSITFRADRPFIAVLWDSQFSIPLFIAKIEDPS